MLAHHDGLVMPLTTQEAKQQLSDKGLTVSDWAKQHGFPVRAVRAVLSGHNKGNYGQSHKIAVALGLKKAV